MPGLKAAAGLLIIHRINSAIAGTNFPQPDFGTASYRPGSRYLLEEK